MIHVSGSCNHGLHATGAYYIAADTIAFMQLIEGDLFKDFPSLRFIIPHGGGAVPYHWGRYRGLADMYRHLELTLAAGHLQNLWSASRAGAEIEPVVQCSRREREFTAGPKNAHAAGGQRHVPFELPGLGPRVRRTNKAAPMLYWGRAA
jgi:hypothetical protein